MCSFGPYFQVREGQSYHLSSEQGCFCLEQMLNQMGCQDIGCKWSPVTRGQRHPIFTIQTMEKKKKGYVMFLKSCVFFKEAEPKKIFFKRQTTCKMPVGHQKGGATMSKHSVHGYPLPLGIKPGVGDQGDSLYSDVLLYLSIPPRLHPPPHPTSEFAGGLS